ncbi:PHP domain-containing protein [Anaerosacchariphilus polymeriproducens]|uniref:PHP domain-containing protein n=1 Tax=Anaerosacchariphilus polymeriproducens TaxID=1812858 RepID=A0A371ARW1_9FIRM|nr:PHP domain-containing protein [Anaerosacchariphilus polymeriproducens]RDU22319.1 PHP domain-containing protein [Anaerosacchariphilus polymeriproducens]
MNYIDLHVHSNASDGTYSPEEIIVYGKKKNLKALALTDHDTVDGLSSAFAAASKYDMELVSGIELSTEYKGKDVHILGLFINWEDPDFLKSLKQFQNSRDLRNEKMILKLNQEAGFDISLKQMKERFGSDVVLTRAHVARYLLEHGYIKSMEQAFHKYIGDNCKYFIPREKVTPQQGIALIQKAKGIPILAHPLLYSLSKNELRILVSSLKESGLMGLEAIYSRNKGFDESNMRQLARDYDLLISGGSDFHGSNKPDIDLGSGTGGLKIPYEVLDNIKAAIC